MITNAAPSTAQTSAPGLPSRRVGWLARTALIAAALGLSSTGLILVSDPADQIGAWLQLGIGVGLAIASLRPRWWSGGLIAAVGTAAGLVVGHLADFFGPAESTIGAGAIAMTLVLLALSSAAAVALARSSR